MRERDREGENEGRQKKKKKEMYVSNSGRRILETFVLWAAGMLMS